MVSRHERTPLSSVPVYHRDANDNNIDPVQIVPPDDRLAYDALHENLQKYNGMDPSLRPTIPRLRTDRETNTILKSLNSVLKDEADRCEDITQLHDLVYSAAMATLQLHKFKPTRVSKKNKNTSNKPGWAYRDENNDLPCTSTAADDASSNINENLKEPPTSSTAIRTPSETQQNFPVNDVSNILTNKLTEEQYISIMNEIWTPPLNFNFPAKKEGKFTRKFNRAYLEQYKWLVYSLKEDGVYCKFCAFFCKIEVGHTSSQQVGMLCTEPYRKWKKCAEKLRLHEKTEYHKRSVLD
ncbi:unnamed protein product [Psylliodes chrysocephalus]|uniref:TTF-type domain-containing protein n=1 Tax=Psylliodes chrysocephalus TaxID=3402493 RepID=A0A9P0CNM4_9CUCU|nr:unnamed protein product [Psylliodes chrysocephala]